MHNAANTTMNTQSTPVMLIVSQDIGLELKLFYGVWMIISNVNKAGSMDGAVARTLPLYQ